MYRYSLLHHEFFSVHSVHHFLSIGKKEKPPQTLFGECPNSTSCTDQEKLRVVGGEDRCLGRVEVWYRGSWGTVCDDSWDMADAKVVCKQLGCGSAVPVPGEAAFGEGTGPIWVESLNCRGTESSLWDCPAKPWGESNCGHKEDVGVNCSGVTETTASLSRTGSRRSLDPLSEAVYEEIDYNLMRKKQVFDGSVSYSDDSVMKLQYYTGDSEGENDRGSEQGNRGGEGASPEGSQLDYDNMEKPALNDVPQTPDSREVPALPGDDPGDGYDDAREISDPEDDPGSGPSAQEVTGVHGGSVRNWDSQTDWSLHSRRSEGASGAESDVLAPAPHDPGYDDVDDCITGTSI
ncbi:antigen WC1.1-like isoform X3 [Mauremys reevesii]|uniref:antigen WC1.1-like isoform X3 n=1 Tax=Mauremys reevesii TaxID=260615 RepID=UPI00193ECB23|nr:antigen WC1.1-like isoform X3 [Mauremys reevesii]